MIVSVIIPAYNAETTLARALGSVQAQDFRFHEVIVVDDGSTDETAAVAERSVLDGLRLVRHAGNRGSSAALNTGIAAASGDWIAFLDADDEWLPGKMSAQLRALEQQPDAALCATGFETVDASGAVMYRYGLEPFPEAPAVFWKRLLRDSAVAKPSVLARRDALVDAGPFDESLTLGEDQDMWLRIAARHPVAYVHEVLLRVHTGAPSLTRGDPLRERDQLLPMIERHLLALWGRLDEPEARAIRAERWARTGQNLASAEADWTVWAAGARLLANAARAGHKPTETLAVILATSPAARWLKRHML